MHQLPFEQQFLLIAQAAIMTALCIRLCLAGLYRVYPFLFSYLLASFLSIGVSLAVPFDSLLYRNSWLVTESVSICLYVLVVLELYSNVLHDTVGIASLSRRYIQIILGIAITASLLLLEMEKTEGGTVAHLFVFERAIMFSLVLFLLLLTAFLVYYPIPLKRNVIVYVIGYAVYFLMKASAIFINNIGYYWNRELSNVRMVACFACLVFWFFALNRRGEAKTVILGHQWNTQDEDRLLAQLKAINASLARTARK